MKTSFLAFAVLASLLLTLADFDLYRRDRAEREVLARLQENIRILATVEDQRQGQGGAR